MANSRRAGSRPWAMAIGAGSTSAAAAAPHWRRASVPAANVSILIWVLAAVLAVAGIDVWQKLARLRTDFGDADDALRMVQVRELMASGHWFDTTLARIGGPAGMLSHWSRLLDLPLAILISFAGLFVPMATAELTVRIIWPALLLVPLYYAVTQSVEIVAGRTCALVALGLIALCPSATAQFSVGRIDHHNLQNLAAVASILLLWLNGRVANAGRWAGLVAGVGIAIGYEALPLVMIATAAATVWGMLDRQAAAQMRAYLLWLAATFIAAFAATTPLHRWGDVYCDAISLNMVLLLACGTGGAALALGRGTAWSTLVRWGVVSGAGLAGAILYALAEPKCLAGPMGQTPAALKSVWLAHVPEAQSWLLFLAEEPHGAVAVALLFAAAAAFLLNGLRRHFTPADAFYCAVFIVSLPLAFWQAKYLPYSSALAIVPVAVLIGRLPAIASLSAPTVRLAALLVCNQYAVMMAVIQLQQAFSPAHAVTIDAAGETGERARTSESAACFRNQNLQSLNSVPPGLMFAALDLGSHLLADTHHKVLAAPYHRIGPQILDTHAILSARDMATAEHDLARVGAHYVLLCPAIRKLITPLDGHPESLDARLRRGDHLDFLETIELPAGSPFKLWRLVARDKTR